MYKRIILKLSGEALSVGADNKIYNDQYVERVAQAISDARDLGVEICVVVGGGNIWRGRQGVNMDDVTADNMGMLATVINALRLQDALESVGVETRVQSAVEMRQFCEPYIRRRALRHLEKGRVVIFAGGLGNPHFTTDTAAALRAAEMEAGAILKGTNVDGAYDCDPNAHKNAVMFKHITYDEVIARNIKVMDATAFTICRERSIDAIRIFNMNDPGNILRILKGEDIGTTVERE